MYNDLIKRLRHYPEDFVAYKMDADFASAVRQAADAIEELSRRVKALEQELDPLSACEHTLVQYEEDSNAEYIEREALCYQLEKQATIDGQPRAIRRAARIVADFPAADVRPVVRGTWEEDCVGAAICSACGEFAFETNTHHLCGWFPNFCPNCGADMRGDHGV